MCKNIGPIIKGKRTHRDKTAGKKNKIKKDLRTNKPRCLQYSLIPKTEICERKIKMKLGKNTRQKRASYRHEKAGSTLIRKSRNTGKHRLPKTIFVAGTLNRQRGRRKEERQKVNATGVLKNEMLFFFSQSPDFYV
jgi:hypothetical protein